MPRRVRFHPPVHPPSPLRASPPTGREGFPSPRLLFVSPPPAVPVLLHSHLAGFDTQAAQLRSLPQTALQLGEPGEAGQAHDVIPQPHRVLLGGQPADDRPEEGHTRGWLEVDDRRADVLAREGQRLVGLRPDLLVERRVVEGAREIRRQAGLPQQWLEEGPCDPANPAPPPTPTE